MRKTKLYVSVALAALLAGCSNEDLVTNNPVVTTGEDRPTANVVLSLNEGNMPDTRLAFEKPEGEGWQWTFKDGDKIGALLMDDWNQTGGHEVTDFTFTDYVHTNYPFIRKTENGETTWSTPEDAAVSAGNYFFYFPYDKTFTYRGFVGWSVNPEQRNYDPETGKHYPFQAVKDNQKWLGYHFVPATDKGVNRINFDFVPLFAMPVFDITNMAMDLQIECMVIRDGSNSTNEDIDLGASSKLLATSMMLAPATGNFMEVAPEWEENDFEWHTSKMWWHAQRYTNAEFDYPSKDVMEHDPQAEVLSFNNEITDREATYQYTVDFGDNYIVKQGDHIQAMLVMPGGVYSNEKQLFEALIYVKNPNNGDRYVVRIGLGTPQTQGGTNTSAWDDIISAGTENFLKPGNNISKFQAQFDSGSLQSYAITDWKATSSDELLWVLEEAAETGLTKLNVTTMGNKVAMTEEVYNALKAHPNYRVYINGAFTIPAGCKEDGINYICYDDNNIKTLLTIEGKQVANKDLNNCEITVTETGWLDTMTNEVTITGNITNNGTVVADRVTSGSQIKNYGTFVANVVEDQIWNYNMLTIQEKVNTVYNYATAETMGEVVYFKNEDAAANWFIRGNQTITQEVVNLGTIQVDNDVVVTASTWKMFDNEGTIVNLGEINRVSVNTGTIYNGNAEDTDATLTLGENQEEGIVYNYGEIKDLAKNNSKIIMQAGTAKVEFRSTDNGTGDIENTVHGDIKNIDGSNQNIIFTAYGQDFKEVLATMLKYGYYTELVIASNYTMQDGTAISTSTAGANMKMITVAQNAIVDIAEEATVQFGGASISLTNYGLINIHHAATLTAGAVNNVANEGNIKKNQNATFTYNSFTGDPVEDLEK